MGKKKLKEEFSYSEYIDAITLTKKPLKVGNNYSPYLINKGMINHFLKYNILQGILFLNALNIRSGNIGKMHPDSHADIQHNVPKQWHFDYLQNMSWIDD